MKRIKIFTSLILASLLLFSQIAVAFAAAPAQGTTYISGEVTGIVVETDPTTNVVTVLVTVLDAGVYQTVRISELAAFETYGLIYYSNGVQIETEWYGYWIDIASTDVIPDPIVPEPEPSDEDQHPVGNALATFFSVDYDVIMRAHEDGVGFGVIAQALWLTRNIVGESEDIDVDIFLAILDAKEKGDYTYFSDMFTDETTPASWGQFKKALLDESNKNNLGTIMSQKEKDNKDKENAANDNSNKDKEKKDKPENSNGSENGKGNGKKP